jgi:hypothetical protein
MVSLGGVFGQNARALVEVPRRQDRTLLGLHVFDLFNQIGLDPHLLPKGPAAGAEVTMGLRQHG